VWRDYKENEIIIKLDQLMQYFLRKLILLLQSNM